MTVEPQTDATAAGRPPAESERYEDFAKLRDDHLRLRESFFETVRGAGAAHAASQLREFLTRVQNTGAVLADPNVRKAAQGVLLYWGAELACLPDAKRKDSLPIRLADPDPSAVRLAEQQAPETDPAIDESKADQRALIRLPPPRGSGGIPTSSPAICLTATRSRKPRGLRTRMQTSPSS